MKFTVATKPLKEALDLGVINSNISKFYQKSNLAQITMLDTNRLVVNLEASNILTEITLKGNFEQDDLGSTNNSVFVDCAMLKSLVASLDTTTVSLETIDGGLQIVSGSSKFKLASIVEGDELELTKPKEFVASENVVEIKKDDWKFIQDYQMYSIAMSFIMPVYTYVWVGDLGVMVGDFENTLFTYSKKKLLNETCLLSSTVINLVTELHEGAKIVQDGDSYLVSVETDGYKYVTEFKPIHETDEGVGSYKADMMIEIIENGTDDVVVNKEDFNNILNQADMLNSDADGEISFEATEEYIKIKDDNVDANISYKKNELTAPYKLDFKLQTLKAILNNIEGESVHISKLTTDGEDSGIVVWTDSMSVMVAGLD